MLIMEVLLLVNNNSQEIHGVDQSLQIRLIQGTVVVLTKKVSVFRDMTSCRFIRIVRNKSTWSPLKVVTQYPITKDIKNSMGKSYLTMIPLTIQDPEQFVEIKFCITCTCRSNNKGRSIVDNVMSFSVLSFYRTD